MSLTTTKLHTQRIRFHCLVIQVQTHIHIHIQVFNVLYIYLELKYLSSIGKILEMFYFLVLRSVLFTNMELLWVGLGG
jgi:hypothetical protein